MTEQELAAIRARLAAAIEGPWKYRHYDDGPRVELRDHPEVTVARVTVPLHPTARFIAAAPADVAALLAEVERLRAFVRVFVKREEGLAPDVGDSMMYNRARALLGESPNP